MLEEVAVVAGQLDDPARARQCEAFDDHLYVAAGVLDPRVGVRGEVGVFAEDLGRGHVLFELDQQAALADTGHERVEGLALVQPIRGDEALAERRHPEVAHHLAEGARTGAADRFGGALLLLESWLE